jgi:nitrogenase molybdenum-iron protein alpha/beta subunit
MPEPSGRMGLLWTLGLIKDAAVLEFGSMGHMIYAEKWMSQTGIANRGRLYTTHLDEKDIALGITKRLEKAVEEIVEEKEAKAIFLLPSSVPEMIGIDLEAIKDELAYSHPQIPILSFGEGNFKVGKSKGVEEALYQLVKFFPEYKNEYSKEEVKEEVKEKIKEEVKEELIEDVKDVKIQRQYFNIFGSVCDTARFASDAREIKRIMEEAFHMEAICTLTSEVKVENLFHMDEAVINLVLRKEGLKAAKLLEREYGIPYLHHAPYGYEDTLSWIRQLEEILGRKADEKFIKEELQEGSLVLKSCKAWTQYGRDKASLWVDGIDEQQGISEFAREVGFRIEKGGILLADKKKLKIESNSYGIEILRSTESSSFNLYESPFMGFRGAMKLCSLWIGHLSGHES